MTIKAATDEDFSRLGSLIAALYPHMAERTLKKFRQDARCFIASDDGGNFVGFAIASMIDYGLDCSGYIDELIVDEKARGQRHGGELLNACTDWLRDCGCNVVFVSTSSDAGRSFYTHHGFAHCKQPWMFRSLGGSE
jgi:GNAT superfamily N-acetyltransferase